MGSIGGDEQILILELKFFIFYFSFLFAIV
jgi:hypothetical protein